MTIRISFIEERYNKRRSRQKRGGAPWESSKSPGTAAVEKETRGEKENQGTERGSWRLDVKAGLKESSLMLRKAGRA